MTTTESEAESTNALTPDQPSALRALRWPFGVSLLLSGVFVVRTWSRTPDGGRLFTLFDDAMISMVYARNLSEGQGLIWSPGHETIEGYTNFAWTLVMATTHTIFPLPDRFASVPIIVIGIAVILGLIWGVWKLALTLRPEDTTAALTAAWLMALAFPMYFWTIRGMEVGVASLMLVGACILALRIDTQWTQRRALALGILLAVAALTRDDLLVPSGIIVLFLIWRFRSDRLIARLAPIVIPVAVAVVGHQIFRIAVYGDMLPNTYYLKVSGLSLATRVDRGFRMLFRQGMIGVWVLAALAVPALWRQRDLRIWLPAGVFASTVVYSVWAGGDAWEWYLFPNRYLCCALPAFLVIAAFGIRKVTPLFRTLSPAGRVAYIGIAVVAIYALSISFPWDQLVLHHDTPQAFADSEWAVQGILINEHTPDDIVVGSITAGNLPYFARRDAIDFLGKNDEVIAHSPAWRKFVPGHNKLDLSYSVGELRPELIAQMWFVNDAVHDQLVDWGYVQANPNTWYLPGYFDPTFLETEFPVNTPYSEIDERSLR